MRSARWVCGSSSATSTVAGTSRAVVVMSGLPPQSGRRRRLPPLAVAFVVWAAIALVHARLHHVQSQRQDNEQTYQQYGQPEITHRRQSLSSCPPVPAANTFAPTSPKDR